MIDIDRTHSRIGYAVFGFFIMLISAAVFTINEITTSSLEVRILYGIFCATGFLTGLLMTLATPVTGSVNTTIRIYKSLLLVPSIGLIITGLFSLLNSVSMASFVFIVMGVICFILYRRTSWERISDHLSSIRAKDPGSDIKALPPEVRTFATHLLVGGLFITIGILGLSLALIDGIGSPIAFSSLLLFGILFAIGAPHTGPLKTNMQIYKAMLIGPGFGFVIAGIYSIATGGSIIGPLVLIIMGSTALYLALIKFSWEMLREAIETVRSTGDPSWEAIQNEVEEMADGGNRTAK